MRIIYLHVFRSHGLHVNFQLVNALLQCRQTIDGVDLWEQNLLKLVVEQEMVNDVPLKQSAAVRVQATNLRKPKEQENEVPCASNQHNVLMDGPLGIFTGEPRLAKGSI